MCLRSRCSGIDATVETGRNAEPAASVDALGCTVKPRIAVTLLFEVNGGITWSRVCPAEELSERVRSVRGTTLVVIAWLRSALAILSCSGINATVSDGETITDVKAPGPGLARRTATTCFFENHDGSLKSSGILNGKADSWYGRWMWNGFCYECWGNRSKSEPRLRQVLKA